MIKYIVLILFFFGIKIFPQAVVYADSIVFSQIIAGNSDSVSYSVINPQNETLEFRIENLKSVYNLSDTLVLVEPFDSVIIWIKYSTNQNVIDNDLLLITASDSTIGKVLFLRGSAKFGDFYDAYTFNLFDSPLKNALTQLVSGHTSLGYNLARDKMYMEIDNKRVNGQGASVNTLECVYTGRLAEGYTSRTDAQNNYNFNTEHTWPQSTFNESEPMRSDLYHLFPTDVNANAIRSNYPFGNVVSGVIWDSAGSRLGRNNLNQIVFEPRDVHKGDVSRSMLYFLIRYPQNYGGFFTQSQENDFREWNELDSVSTIESARNNAIALLQQKRNPFIDHPEFTERIYSFTTNNPRPVIADLDILPLKLNYDSTAVGNSSLLNLYLINRGSAQLIIDSVIISDNSFNLVNFNSLHNPFSFEKVLVQFSPDSIKSYNAVITVFTNGGQKQVALTGIGKDNTVEVVNEYFAPTTFSLEQNYPNPFNPTTKIKFTIPSLEALDMDQTTYQATTYIVTLKVYNMLGRLVATLVNEEKPAGSYEVEFSSYTGKGQYLTSGVYLYRLQVGSFFQIRKMIIIK